MGVKISQATLLDELNDYLMFAVGNTGLDEQESAVRLGQVKDYTDSDKAQVAFTGSYLNLSDTPNLDAYVLMTTLNQNYYNRNQVNQLIGGMTTIKFVIVEELPETGDNNVIYLIEHVASGGDLIWHEDINDPLAEDEYDVYDEYVWLPDGQTFEKIGTTQVTFADYYTKSEIDMMIQSVGNGTITINQGGVQKGTFTLNQSGNTVINLDAGGGGTQVQADWAVEDPSDPSFILNKPTIPYVSDVQITLTQGGVTKGSFTLNQGNATTINFDSVGQVQSDWNENDNTDPSYIKNKPSIPTVNNPTITLRQSGVVKGVFTLNQSSSQTIDLETGGGSLQVQSDWAQTDTTAVNYIANKPSLATVATSGSYNDLTNKPSTKTWVITYDNNTTETIQILYNPVV